MHLNLLPSSKLWRAAVLGMTFASFTPDSQAITASWDAVANISNANDVRTDGTLFGAWTFRNSGTGPQGTGPNAPFTLNGVTFTNITNAAGSGNVAVSIPAGSSANFAKVELTGPQQTSANATGTSYNLLPNAYKGIVMGTFALYQQGVNRPMTLTVSGLTENKTYMVQLWCAWPNGTGFYGGTKYTIKHPSDPLQDATSPLLDSNTTNTFGGAGQYVTGTFTTGPGETSVTIVATTGNVSPAEGSAWVSFNAMQIREVNKHAWFKNAKYGIGITWLPYPPGITGVPSADQGPTWSEWVRSKPELGDRSEWAKIVDDFNVPAFVSQVEQTGAGYVLFAVGGTTGIYCSPNAAYETSVGADGNGNNHGPFYPGEYTPKTRDLINDLAVALNAKGIKLMVYLPAEGPMRDYYLKRGPTSPAQVPGYATHARDGILLNQDLNGDGQKDQAPAYSNAFRAKYHAMIAEWSNRWKSKVAGWWLDGVYSPTGYRNSVFAENNDAPGNLVAMAAAMRTGNPNALVAFNPAAEDVRAISPAQDYTAGEQGLYGDTRAKFFQYPYSQFTSNGSNTTINNHYYSYLGRWWDAKERKYVDEELINYIASVNEKGAVVTMSIGAEADGHLPDELIEQLARVKAALKPNVAPVSVPLTPVKFTNLALYKPAWMLRANSNYGDPAIPPPWHFQNQTHAAVDGDSYTWTIPAPGDAIGWFYAYDFIVDLESVQYIDRISVHYRNDRFATKYSLEVSLTGAAGTWSLLNSGSSFYTATAGGLHVHDADSPKQARFIRLRNLLPTWDTDPGVQPGIQEFGVFNISGTLSSQKETVWVDEEFPTDADITTAGAASWQTASTLNDSKTVPALNPADYWSNLSADGVPFPFDGIKLHWNKLATGHNEHGFENSADPLRAASGDNLYCDVYLDPANPTTEILLKWKASDGTEGRARWGADTIPLGGLYVGPLPATGQWVRLSVPANSVGLGGKTLTGMSFATYDGRTFFDRAGKVTP